MAGAVGRDGAQLVEAVGLAIAVDAARERRGRAGAGRSVQAPPAAGAGTRRRRSRRRSRSSAFVDASVTVPRIGARVGHRDGRGGVVDARASTPPSVRVAGGVGRARADVRSARRRCVVVSSCTRRRDGARRRSRSSRRPVLGGSRSRRGGRCRRRSRWRRGLIVPRRLAPGSVMRIVLGTVLSTRRVAPPAVAARVAGGVQGDGAACRAGRRPPPVVVEGAGVGRGRGSAGVGPCAGAGGRGLEGHGGDAAVRGGRGRERRRAAQRAAGVGDRDADGVEVGRGGERVDRGCSACATKSAPDGDDARRGRSRRAQGEQASEPALHVVGPRGRARERASARASRHRPARLHDSAISSGGQADDQHPHVAPASAASTKPTFGTPARDARLLGLARGGRSTGRRPGSRRPWCGRRGRRTCRSVILTIRWVTRPSGPAPARRAVGDHVADLAASATGTTSSSTSDPRSYVPVIEPLTIT